MFVVSAAFLIFDLDDKLYPKSSQYSANIDYTEAPKQTVLAEQSSVQEPAKHVIAQQEKSTQKPFQTKTVVPEPKSRLVDLEQRQFRLNLSGDAYVGMSGMVKKVSLILKLVPVKGAGLQEFRIIESRFILDSSGVPISGTGVKINGKDITIEFVADNVGTFAIHGTLDEKILDDKNNKQHVILEDQDFFLIKKDMPYRLNMVGTLEN